eukprot:gene5130-3550_t
MPLLLLVVGKVTATRTSKSVGCPARAERWDLSPDTKRVLVRDAMQVSVGRLYWQQLTVDTVVHHAWHNAFDVAPTKAASWTPVEAHWNRCVSESQVVPA